MKFFNVLLILGMTLIGFNLNAQKTYEVKERAPKQLTRISVMKIPATSKYTVKVLNPHGEIEATPIKSRPMAANEMLNIKVDTKYWRKGTYTILVENEEKRVVKKKNVSIK